MINYELFIGENKEEKVKFNLYDTNYERPVLHDESGNKYFTVPRKLEGDDYFTFNDRVKDAYDSIKNGIGDVISTNNIFSATFTNVVYFLNREVGEAFKKLFLEGWKDVKFGYCIQHSYINRFMINHIISKNLDFNILCNKDILYFHTQEEADNFVKEILEKAALINKKIVENNLTVVQIAEQVFDVKTIPQAIAHCALNYEITRLKVVQNVLPEGYEWKELNINE